MAANKENLIVPSSEEARKNGAKGGRASGAARRKKKTLREIAEAFGSAQAPDEIKAKLYEQGLVSKKKITNDEAMLLAQIAKANKGDVKSATYLAEIRGEKIQRIEQVTIDDRSISRMQEDFGYADVRAGEGSDTE